MPTLQFSSYDLISIALDKPFVLGIAYETDIAVVEQLPGLIREIITENQLAVRFDRAHFKGYGDSALLFEVVYQVLSPDDSEYMDIQQKINLALLRLLKDRGVEFAYPTRTLHIVPPIAPIAPVASITASQTAPVCIEPAARVA